MSTDLTLPEARAERDALAARTDVLDKVAVLRTLPDNMHCTTPMVAEFYEVDVTVIRQVVSRNQDEFNCDGYETVTRADVSDKLSLTWSELEFPAKAHTAALFPRRAILRLGMLLRDSLVARRVRDYLLNVEEASPVRELTEDEIVHRALHILDSKVKELTVENRTLHAAIERDAPLVAKAEAHTANAKAINRQAFAREVQQWGVKQGVSILQEQVYELLRRKGMLIDGHRADRNHATAQAVKAGWAWTAKDVTEDGHPTAVTKLNPRGQDIAWKWITDYVADHGSLVTPPKLTGGAA